MTDMRLSIALCTYNGEKYLQQLLESIDGQTRKPEEIVICDDGSTDRTIEVINRFSSRSSITVKLFINEYNLGITKNFEKAISLCSGDIIFLSDQDDIWHYEKLKTFEQKFTSLPDVGIIFSNANLVDENLKTLNNTLWVSIEFDRKKQSMVENKQTPTALLNDLERDFAWGATMAFRSCYKDLILPIPWNWAHDTWIMLIIGAVVDVAFISQPLIEYRQHSQQECGAPNNRNVLFLVKNITNEIKEMVKNRLAYRDNTNRNIFKLANKYETAYDKLSKINTGSKNTIVIQILKNKSDHFKSRSIIISKKRLHRMLLIVKEFTMYRKHSKGLYSAVKDFII
jgi:glycosyltransferase involved in cell wall biosynthesis